MSTSSAPRQPASATSPHRSDYLAALLSYLIPGLGQIYQGRFGKGLMFAACLLGMFFYGMRLGEWKNVYLPNQGEVTGIGSGLPGPLKYAIHRLPFAGQFWIGVAAWPAILHYYDKPFVARETSEFWHNFQRTPREDDINRLQAQSHMGKLWDLGLVYTVIAGVLNILVIYDAFAGPALQGGEESVPTPAPPQEAAA